MSETLQNRHLMVVDLKNDILLSTTISPENHAALRSGFVGYPANPRWNIRKYQAWKEGSQLRQALERGELVVRSSDSQLVCAAQIAPENEENQATTTKKRVPWSEGIKQIFRHYQILEQ